MFQCDPTIIKEITHYAFYENRLTDGALFCIPESPRLFATESVVDRIKKSGLKGIRMPLLP